MRLLVIDTALGACTAVVAEDGCVLSVRSEIMARGHSERLGGFVRDAVSETSGGFSTLDRIGVTVGPGSFTGLRVGLAFALGLGTALGRPVVGLSTLQALAWSAHEGPSGNVAAIIDARRGEVYLQRFCDGAPVSEAEALSHEAARTRLAGQDWRGVGNGVELIDPDRASDIHNPSPEALAALAASVTPAEAPARPLYLRAPDATPPTRLPGQPRLAS